MEFPTLDSIVALSSPNSARQFPKPAQLRRFHPEWERRGQFQSDEGVGTEVSHFVVIVVGKALVQTPQLNPVSQCFRALISDDAKRLDPALISPCAIPTALTAPGRIRTLRVAFPLLFRIVGTFSTANG